MWWIIGGIVLALVLLLALAIVWTAMGLEDEPACFPDPYRDDRKDGPPCGG